MKTPRNSRNALLLVGLILLLSFALIRNDGVLYSDVTSDESIGVSSGQTTSTGPTFFDAPFYHGAAATLPVGNYDLVDLNAHGIRDNGISSVKVSPGFKVVAFANPDFTGASIILAGDTPRLQDRGFDHQISSLRISRFSVGATFYEECARGGKAVSLPVGEFTSNDLLQWGIANDSISGVVPGSDMEVELFRNDFLSGGSRLVNKVNLCLTGGGLDNETSSLRIRYSPVLFQDNFDTGSLSQWASEIGDWQVVNGAMVGIGWGLDAWTYATTSQSITGPIVIDIDVNMASGNADIVLDSTGYGVDEYRVQIWSQTSPVYPNRYQITRHRDGEVTRVTTLTGDVLDGNVLSPLPIPTRCHITVRRLGATFNLYINGRRIASATDPEPLPASGKFGLGVIWDMAAAFDNVVVRH